MTQTTSYSLDSYQDAIGEWRWRLTHQNGETVAASSEGFSSKSECHANARRTYEGLKACIPVAAP